MSSQSIRAGRFAGRFLGLGVGLVTLSITMGAAQAHILLVDPKPRDQNDTHKSDAMACAPARTMAQPVTMMDGMGVAYQGGNTITVKWAETTNHPGCFEVDISPMNDANWVSLGTMKHSAAGKTPRAYQTTVKLPDGMTCDKCTLRVRQYMLKADPPTCPPADIPPDSTYYQCANVVLKGGSTPPADAGAPDATAGTGGATGTPTGGSSGTPTGGSSGTPTGGAMGTPTGGSSGTGGKPATGGSTGGGDTGGAGEEETGGSSGGTKRDSGGCAIGGRGPAGGLLLLATLALIARRRRR